MRALLFLSFIALILSTGCSSSKSASGTTGSSTDTVFVNKMRDYTDYHGTIDQLHDLIHTKLEVSFDMPQSLLHGKAWVTLTPWFYATDKLTLDAKGFDLHAIELVGPNGNQTLQYEYDTLQVHITLDKEYQAGDQFTVYIDYTAKPDELEEGGSASITSDKGLYFINGDGKDKNKRQEIWTQGETEASSCWFPTIDKPNQNTTQEISITVDSAFVTLSNGILESSTNNKDGTRTDYWVMHKRHAPYLFMMAIGDYAIVKDSWNGMDVHYYVDPKYAPYARNIFKNTLPMLDFYSEEFGVRYPWSKYHQVSVTDFVSGAMENTTAVIFGDFMNRTDREMLDSDGEAIVAHEMVHHWFGDLVTCESWSNLTLNESFASYGEYLWFNHHYGADRADHGVHSERNGYLWGASKKQRSIVDWNYKHREDMFDSHSYNKGSLVLHMLRDLVGPDAFRKALKLYLEDNAYQPAEIHHLRLAFEEVIGKDLNWFFDQWWLQPGHPKLKITYDEHTNENGEVNGVTVHLTQNKSHEKAPVFILPMNIDIYTQDGQVVRERIFFDQPAQSFTFKVNGKPNLINVDANKTLLCEKEDLKSTDQFVYQYFNAPLWADRREALGHSNALIEEAELPKIEKMLTAALDDKYFSLRRYAIDNMDTIQIQTNLEKIMSLAANDPSSKVRGAAYKALGKLKSNEAYAALQNGLNDSSYFVITNTLTRMHIRNTADALKAAARFENSTSKDVITKVADIYADTGGVDKDKFFRRHIANESGYYKYMYISSYMKYLARMDDALTGDGLVYLNSIDYSEMPHWFGKYMRRSAKKIEDKYKAHKEALADAEETEQLEQVEGRLDSLSKLMENFKKKKT
jgi:aminopeptidase N